MKTNKPVQVQSSRKIVSPAYSYGTITY